MAGFKVTTRVLIVENGRLLLVRDEGKEFWYPPGGTLEPGEDVRSCAAREVLKEFPNATWGRHDIEAHFLCRADGGEPAPPLDDAAEARWFTQGELDRIHHYASRFWLEPPGPDRYLGLLGGS